MVVTGVQWGDEGKGRVVDLVCEPAQMVVRHQGGCNAGHTVVADGITYKLHLVPSGIVHSDKQCVIANGVVIDPETLAREIDGLRSQKIAVGDNLLISERAHVTMPYHKLLDEKRERGASGIGSTRRGVGPTYADKVARYGIRVIDLFREPILKTRLEHALDLHLPQLDDFEQASELSVDNLLKYCRRQRKVFEPHVADTTTLINDAIDAGQNVLFEGAQAVGLDIDVGTYPYVTSSNPGAGGVCTGAGVGPTRIHRVIGVAKAYCTRVGGGPFPSRMEPAIANVVQECGAEYGTTTGRPRDCGWFDAVEARFAVRTSGIGALAITKLDVLDDLDEIRLCSGYQVDGETINHFPADLDALNRAEPVYETFPGWRTSTSDCRRLTDLPANARAYVDRVTELAGAPLALISVGPSREQCVMVDESLLAYDQ